MSKRKWAKVRRGDVVELGGREWTVEKIKPKGKHLRVDVRSGGHTASSKVDPDEKVRLAGGEPKRPRTTPPKPATGDPWETQQDRIERKLDEILHARLVGEATDTDVGYYVPPVDVTTIASHMAIFHGGIPDAAEGDEARMLELHSRAHVATEAGDETLAINHWHTDRRPTTGRKGSKK